MTTSTGYLAIAVWKHSDGNVSDMTVGFADTEDAALAQGKAYVDENTLPEHTSELMSLTAYHAREIGSNDRWSYADDDVVWTGADGCYVKANATKIED